MDNYIVQSPVAMPRGSLLRIDDGAGVLVNVWEGELWVTQEGSAQDHVLGPGQSFRLDRGGAAVMHAFRRSVISLSAAVPEVPARRISLAGAAGAGPVVLHRAGTRPLWQAIVERLVAPLRAIA